MRNQQSDFYEPRYTMTEAAERSGVSYRSLKRYIQSGAIYPFMLKSPEATGHRWLFSEADIQRAPEICEDNLTNMRIGLHQYMTRRRSFKQNSPLAYRALQDEKRRSL